MNARQREKDKDKYAIVKGKALTMVREFVKLYPDYEMSDLNARIAHEVVIACKCVFGDTNYSRAKTQAICFEIKESIVGGIKYHVSGGVLVRAEKQEEQSADLHQSENS